MISKRNPAFSMLGWGAVIIWFSANILSQAAFIGMHGVPYDATNLLTALGSWSWVIVVAELLIWAIAGLLIFNKIRNKKQIIREIGF